MEKVTGVLPESVKIEDGIAALTSVGIWPENVEEPGPAYSNEAGTLYLQIFPRSFNRRFIRSATADEITLQHPLSLNRSVCVILQTVEEKDTALIKKLLISLGVTGEITFISSQDSIENVASDTTIVSSEISEAALKSLKSKLSENNPGKTVGQLLTKKKKPQLKRKLSVILRKTVVVPNAFDGSFLVKVGHRGMLANEIKDNVMGVFCRLNISARFKGGWASVKSVSLIRGPAQMVSLYKRSGDPEPVMKIKKTKKLKRKSDGRSTSAGPMPKKAKEILYSQRIEDVKQAAKVKSERQEKKDGGVAEKQVQAGGPNLKRKLQDAVESNVPASVSPKKGGKALEGLNNVAGSKPTQALTNGSAPKDQAVGSPNSKKNKQRKGKGDVQLPSSEDLMNMLINRAKESVFTPEQEPAAVPSAPLSQLKKNKKNKAARKGDAKTLLPVVKGGELSEEFKQHMMASLQMFTRGTELEDIVRSGKAASPVKAEKKPIVHAAGDAGKTAEVKPTSGSPGKSSLKKKKIKKNKSPKLANLANGTVQMKPAENGSAENTTPKKKKKNKKNKTPQKANLVTPLANGNPAKAVKVTKVVALESPGTKLKKKKNKSPKKAKVAAL